jgi:hypothetical protein
MLEAMRTQHEELMTQLVTAQKQTNTSSDNEKRKQTHLQNSNKGKPFSAYLTMCPDDFQARQVWLDDAVSNISSMDIGVRWVSDVEKTFLCVPDG